MTIYLIRDTTYYVAEGYTTTYEAAQEWIKKNPICLINKRFNEFEIVAVDELPT